MKKTFLISYFVGGELVADPQVVDIDRLPKAFRYVCNPKDVALGQSVLIELGDTQVDATRIS